MGKTMAYEVIKKRGKRAYRYRVEYIRNAQGTGQTRWQYLGPVESTSEIVRTPAQAHGRVATSSRLLDALEKLLIRGDYADVTASAVAHEAGVAHGTFYRYFKDKRDALQAAMQRLVERAEELATLAAATTSRDQERQRVRHWLQQKLLVIGEYPGVWLAWSALSQTDPAISLRRQTLRANYRRMFELYLQQLQALGHTEISDTAAAARTIFALINGILQDGFSHNQGTPAPEVVEHACMMVDRAIFGSEHTLGM